MKVVSLSFFRHDASGYEDPRAGTSRGIFFVSFLATVIRAHHAVWDGWELVLHHDDRVRAFPYFKALEKMQERGLLTLSYAGPAPTLCGAMLWRLRPLLKEDTEIVVCRDLDSLPMHRDRKMVEAFLAAPHAVAHAVHDSESHAGPLMGGMIALKGPHFRSAIAAEVERRLPEWSHRLDQHGSDQFFLNKVVYPLVRDGLLLHTKRQTVESDCLRALPVAPQETELDKVVTHIGAGYYTDRAMAVLDRMQYPNKDLIEECERQALSDRPGEADRGRHQP